MRVTAMAVAVLAAAIAPAGATGSGAAAERARARREVAARRACAAGRVEQGIALLAALEKELRHPNYLYNQARCYQQNGRAEPAIARFRDYLRADPAASRDVRRQVERFIRELEAEVAVSAPVIPGASPSTTTATTTTTTARPAAGLVQGVVPRKAAALDASPFAPEAGRRARGAEPARSIVTGERKTRTTGRRIDDLR
jgi:hypothetical protein